MTSSALLQSIGYDESGFLRVEATPGYALLGTWMTSDLWGVEEGPYQEIRAAAVRGLDGQSDEISGNGFSVEVEGDITTITLLARPERDLRLSTADLLVVLDQYATVVLGRRTSNRGDPSDAGEPGGE